MRQAGYYWVALGGRWTVGEWNPPMGHMEGMWFLAADENQYADDDFEHIGARIPAPDEHQTPEKT